MKGVYRLNIDFGRMGEVEGIFVAESEAVKNIIGKYIYFGEILGKHSEVKGTPEEDEIELITEDQTAVEVIEKHGLETGYNPFDYLN